MCISKFLDVSRSSLAKEAIFLTGAALVHAPICLGMAAIYAWLYREKIIHELALIFLNIWRDLPNLEVYEKDKKEDHTFYRQRSMQPLCLGNIFGGKHYIDPIVKLKRVKIAIGGIPHHHHAKWLKEKGYKTVISLVEDHEYDVPKCIANIVQPKEWKDYDIKIYRYPSVDRMPLKKRTLAKVIKIARSEIEQGRSVYFHCRAGQGRAPTAATAAISNLLNIPIREVLKEIHKARPQAELNFWQRIKLYQCSDKFGFPKFNQNSITDGVKSSSLGEGAVTRLP